MSFQRRAAAPRLIDWTGERCVPWTPDVPVIYEHFHRYLWAAGLVGGRRVLDLGSGEGFGSAILAQTAAHVVGVDIDELTVEHSRLNYAGPKLDFALGTALDLAGHDDNSFDAVVAFEVIEHVREQERVLGEIARVLDDNGIVIMSTPDRRMYDQGRSDPNPFHEKELALQEFLELLESRFTHVAAWGQRTITGSHLHALGDLASGQESVSESDFFIERTGDEWRVAAAPVALYCVALASKAQLPTVASGSTLVDCGLELMRVKERDTAVANGETRQLAVRLEELAARLEREKQEVATRLEREKQELTDLLERERADYARARQQWSDIAREDGELRAHEAQVAHERVTRFQQTLVLSEQRTSELGEMLTSVDKQLALARQANRRTEESVTWQAFQKGRRRLYGAIGGERSLRARAMSAALLFLGRRLTASPAGLPPSSQDASVHDAAAVASRETIEFPTYARPQVSFILSVHAHADLTRACLRSIREHTADVRYEVILVDDVADAETQQLLEDVRGAKIIRNDANLDYLLSMNRGASAARGEWLVLGNNDTEVTPGWLSAMLACAEDFQDVAVVTPKFIYPDGTLNEAGAIVWRDGTGVNYGRGDARDRCIYEYRREVDYGSAAAVLVRTDFWNDVGGFDEQYAPGYYEDTDLCFQARERGLRVMYEPEALVVHIEGATHGKDPGSGTKRHQEQNRLKFVRKWRNRLEAEHLYPVPANVRGAANRHPGPHVLVMDHRVPMPDRDSGSLRMLNILQVLIELGARVTFVPDNLASTEPYTRALQRMGVEVLYGPVDVKAELAAIGPGLTAAILCRPHTAGRWLDTVRELAPAARIAYDTVDLHWLREARRGGGAAGSNRLATDNGTVNVESMWPKAKALRELELAMIRATEVTLVVSETEDLQVHRDVPGANVLVVPNVHQVESHVPLPQARSGILFVGGFEHVPNVDAALCLVKEVMPLIWRELGDVSVTIAGPDAPPEVQALASPQVNVVGWVENLQPLLERSRALVAPLRYGAGLKGKVTQCLAAGLPVVTTSIGAEGLTRAGSDDADGRCLLVADDAQEIAQMTARLCRDDEMWLRLSRAGQAFIAENCSIDVVTRRLSELVYRESPLPLADASRRGAARRAQPSAREDADSELEPHLG
jgi:GT2 family glycosyltransferase/SAM-dependent methyltransferase/glycosyltransferase involved in cell wall biosynthesis